MRFDLKRRVDREHLFKFSSYKVEDEYRMAFMCKSDDNDTTLNWVNDLFQDTLCFLW